MNKSAIAGLAGLFAAPAGAHQGMHPDGLVHQLLHAVGGNVALLCAVVGAALVCGFVIQRAIAARAG